MLTSTTLPSLSIPYGPSPPAGTPKESPCLHHTFQGPRAPLYPKIWQKGMGESSVSADKDPHSQKYGFSSSLMYRRESWTIKNAECRRIDAFKLWCWRRLLRVPWTARRSNQSILKETSQS